MARPYATVHNVERSSQTSHLFIYFILLTGKFLLMKNFENFSLSKKTENMKI